MKPLTCDAHIDLLWILSGLAKQTRPTVDAQRMQFGGLDKMVLALYVADHVQKRLGEGDTWKEVLLQMQKAKSFFPEHYIALEGGSALGRDPVRLTSRFRDLAKAGIKYFTLMHNEDNLFGGSATDVTQMGLTRLGREMVENCDDEGVMVDVSHASDRTTDDILAMWTGKPIIASHSGCRAVNSHIRNLLNSQIVRIGMTEGIVCIPFAQKFVSNIEGVADHVDHVVQLTGSVLRVGIGSDLDGAVMVEGCRGAEDWSKVVIDSLSKKGYSDNQIRMIAGGNLLRLFGAK